MPEIDTTDPRADYPPDQQFVNQGWAGSANGSDGKPDRRFGGALGKRLALIQRLNSFKSAEPPTVITERLPDGGWHEVQLWPNGKRHDAYAFPRANGKWDTFRYGHRWDPNWGDANTRGYNPQPEIVGGGILDVVIKLNQTRTYIAEVG